MPAKKTAKVSKPAKKLRKPQRAPGKTQTSISMSVSFMEWAWGKAASEGRSLSNWIEQLIRGLRDAE